MSPRPCPRCHGNGVEPSLGLLSMTMPCLTCGGTGDDPNGYNEPALLPAHAESLQKPSEEKKEE